MNSKNIIIKETVLPEDRLQRLVEDYLPQKQTTLMQVKKGKLEKKVFLQEAEEHIKTHFDLSASERRKLLKSFEQYIFGYSSPSNSFIQTATHASDGMCKSPRGDTPTLPTFGPSGKQERLNCCAKNLR